MAGRCVRVLGTTLNLGTTARNKVTAQKYSLYGVLCNYDGSDVSQDEEHGVVVTFSSAANARSSEAPPFQPIKPAELVVIDPNWAISTTPPNGCVLPAAYSLCADTANYTLVPDPTQTTEREVPAPGTKLITNIRNSHHPEIEYNKLKPDDPFPVVAAMVVGVIPPTSQKAPTNVKLVVLTSKVPVTMAIWSCIAGGKELTAYMSSLVGQVAVIEHASCSKHNPLYDFSIAAGPETRIWLGSAFLTNAAIDELHPGNLEDFFHPLPVFTGHKQIKAKWNALNSNQGYEEESDEEPDEEPKEEKSQVE